MAIGGTDDRADDAEAEIDVDSDPLNNMTERCKAGGTDACKDGNARVANRAMHRDDPLLTQMIKKGTEFQYSLGSLSSSTQLAKLLLLPKTAAAPPLGLRMTPPPSCQPAATKPVLLQ